MLNLGQKFHRFSLPEEFLQSLRLCTKNNARFSLKFKRSRKIFRDPQKGGGK
jgi:hypothetical protein